MSKDRANVLLREAQKAEAHRLARAADADRQKAEGKKPLDRAIAQPGAEQTGGFVNLNPLGRQA